MRLDSFEEVKKITESLIRIPSVVGAAGQETACAEKVYEYYAELPYFQKNPKQLYLLKTEDDAMDRHSAVAYVRGTKGSSRKTVILMGHIDTVGVDDFTPDSTIAFDPERIPEHLLKTEAIDPQVKADIESGEFLFGRGALDMKSGVACQMYVVKYFSEHPEELDGNLLAIAHCDEEDMSHGILTGLIDFKRLKAEEGFEYIASINSDYCTPYFEGDENRYIYFGAVGKLLPSFYIVGRETHVGQPYGGLDPNLIAAEITHRIELNTGLCDESHGEITMPPVSLKQADRKELYTVQTAGAAYCYYNFFTHSMSPKDVMEKVKTIAEEAFEAVIGRINASWREYCGKANFQYRELPWKARVLTYQEFYEELKGIHGDGFEAHIREFSHRLNQEQPLMDLRNFSVRIIEEAWKWSSDKNPAVILYFSSSYCPRVEVTGKDEKERRLISAVDEAVGREQPCCRNTIIKKWFFPYISDASFMAVCDDEEALAALEKNMPAWGEKYTHKVKDILEINVPVVNIGSHGQDGHKYTERVHQRYTFENVTNMIYNTVRELLPVAR
ncbi:MAG TPA: M20/M25/M40 family metallo-hydrolase [Anaerovoracaceae bacterium]|nr:M20/M25/M40 family metallo-hydrolase [Anaerovoracaceae bacterium]